MTEPWFDDLVADDTPDRSAPPHSPQAEQAVLGSVLKDPGCLAQIANWLKPAHFYSQRALRVYRAMLALFDRGQACDLHTIAEELERQGTFSEAGGMVYLATVDYATPTASHVELYARIVVGHAIRREYLDAAQRMAELAWDVRNPVEQVKRRAEALVLGVGSSSAGPTRLGPSDWTPRLIDYLSRTRAVGGLAGISTGLVDLDWLTLGLSPGWLYLIGARTGTGKTEIACQIALHVSEHAGPVVFVSMELNDVDLGVRFVSSTCGISKERLVTGQLDEQESAAAVAALNRLHSSRIHISYGGDFTCSDVRAVALQTQAVEGTRPALVVVDYLQLLRDQEGDGKSRERNVSLAARSLKALAQELQVPVLALAQFSRASKERSDKRPTLTDLRESGDLENTADSVLGLYREELEKTTAENQRITELSVLKKRQLGAEVGTVRKLIWMNERYQNYYQQPGQHGRLVADTLP